MQRAAENPSSHMYWSRLGTHEYMLTINPGEAVNKRIERERQDLCDQFGAAVAKTDPNITIANFFAKEEMEETLIKWIHRVCSQLTCFSLTLNQLTGSPPVIYTKVLDPLLLQVMIQPLKVIDAFLGSSSCPPLHVINKPHLAIAKLLTSDGYEKAIKMYESKSFHESFMVNEVSLYKRSSAFDCCKRINVFRLMPQ